MISAGRVLIIPKGEYNAATAYSMLDLVSYNGSSYIAKQSTTGNLPTNPTYWQLSAYGGSAANIAGNFAQLETTDYASQNYSVGDYLVTKDSELCKVIDTITTGDELVIDTNIEVTTVEEMVADAIDHTDTLDAENVKLKGLTAISVQTDLNSVTTLGNYYKSGTSFYVTNAPTGIDSDITAVFRLTVENGSDTTNKYIQTIVTNNGKLYKRGYNGSAWSDWIEYVSKAVADTKQPKTLDTPITIGGTSRTTVEAALGALQSAKADSSDLGTAAAKDSTSSVTEDDTDLVESGAVYTALTAKQPKTLDTPITVDSVQQTTVEGALGAINTYAGEIDAGLSTLDSDKVEKTDLTSIIETGSTASQAISNGTYFYLDGVIVRAKAAIAGGATFTLNTNYEVLTVGALNKLTAAGIYSTSEVNTGQKWIDGKDIYRKVLEGTLSYDNSQSPVHSIDVASLNVGYILNFNTIVDIGGQYVQMVQWALINNGVGQSIDVYYDRAAAKLKIRSPQKQWNGYSFKVIFEYTKAS